MTMTIDKLADLRQLRSVLVDNPESAMALYAGKAAVGRMGGFGIGKAVHRARNENRIFEHVDIGARVPPVDFDGTDIVGQIQRLDVDVLAAVPDGGS